jgi:hypothetical protein
MIDKILFVMEKYCDGDIRCGPTNSESMLVGAIKSTGLVYQTKQFYFDVLCHQLGRRRMSRLLLEQCAEFKPDLVIFTPLFTPLEPPRDAIDKIANVLRIKVYIQLFDSYTVRINSWLPFGNYVGIIDMLSTRLGHRGNPKIIQAYSAINPQDFYDKNLRRDIDVSFIGSIDPGSVQWPLRYEYINFLRDNGINVVTCGGQRYNRIPTEECSNILNRSKISLSFCRRSDGASQLKGRVFEAMACKSLVLEDDGSETREFFEVGRDFVIFHDKKELLGKVLYYLKHDREREEIAQSGYEKVTNLYNATNMWAYVFGKMGFELPNRLIDDKNYLLHQIKMESIIRSGYSKVEKVAKENKTEKVIKWPRLLALAILRNLIKILLHLHFYIYYIIGFFPSFIIRLALIRLNMTMEKLHRALFSWLASLPYLRKMKRSFMKRLFQREY